MQVTPVVFPIKKSSLDDVIAEGYVLYCICGDAVSFCKKEDITDENPRSRLFYRDQKNYFIKTPLHMRFLFDHSSFIIKNQDIHDIIYYLSIYNKDYYVDVYPVSSDGDFKISRLSFELIFNVNKNRKSYIPRELLAEISFALQIIEEYASFTLMENLVKARSKKMREHNKRNRKKQRKVEKQRKN